VFAFHASVQEGITKKKHEVYGHVTVIR